VWVVMEINGKRETDKKIDGIVTWK